MKNKRKDYIFSVRIPGEDLKNLDSVAKFKKVTRSEFVREVAYDACFHYLRNRNNFYVECGKVELIYNK